jgi:acyl-CoA synthetase (AMP-forming)/AMP-acid ligase II
VELGVTTGANVGADPRRAGVLQQAVTEHILGLADRAGYRAALIDAADATVTTWPQFALTVRAAGRGLSRRGLQSTDTVGVFVQDAASHAVAVHAIRAAGAVAAPVHPAATAADAAARLKACRARLLITSAALAELAVQAAERSWVRQVFTFGEAAGTTPFDSLLEAAKHGHHDHGTDPLGPDASTWSVTGAVAEHILDQAGLTSADGAAFGPEDVDGAGLTSADGAAFGPEDGDGAGLGRSDADEHRSWLTCRDVVVAAPPCGDPNAYTALLDLALAAGATIVAAPVGRVTAAVRSYKGTAAIVARGTGVHGLPATRIFTVG